MMTPPPATSALTNHFKKVNDFRTHIYQLQHAWDSLALMAHLSGTGSEMAETRSAFNAISNAVLDHLSAETVRKTAAQLGAKAYEIINVLVRNLFERTADIGFFATDNTVRDYLEMHARGQLDSDDRTQLATHFKEYQAKYTVYENIVLFDAQGKRLHQLDASQQLLTDGHPIVALALQTDAPYIEQFYASDRHGEQHKSLVYAHAVRSHDNQHTLGVLCLCFKFVDELDTIFRNLITATDWTVGVLLDEQRCVIASSDPHQIPLGIQLSAAPEEAWFIARFAGREYVCVTHASEGYQGYFGPGWLGQAMIPLEQAFNQEMHDMVNRIDDTLLRKVMRSPLIFSESLLNIPKQAAQIQSKLNQSVWNGNIRQSSYVNTQQKNFSKSLLSEISHTGHKTQTIIERMVAELYQTVVSVMLENSSFYAQLAVDILDRNLYERANDVRWWALTHAFRDGMAKKEVSPETAAALTEILRAINRLYTVYDNLILFDRQGQVIAVSHPQYADLVGTLLTQEWVGRTRSCNSTQDYVVSAFEATPLYGDRPTYIYAAPVRHLDGNSIVGGIAIVFDSAPQFQAMLRDVIPRDSHNQPVEGGFTVFVNEALQVIASTHPAFATGQPFNLMPDIAQLTEGGQLFDIAHYDDTYYAVGAHAAYGYREYKGEHDPYRNKVVALIFTPLGNVQAINQRIAAEAQLIHNTFNPSLFLQTQADSQEYATFFVGDAWLGIEARYVKEAINAGQLRSLPEAAPLIAGMHSYQQQVIPVIDLAAMLGHTHYYTDDKQIIVIEDSAAQRTFGVFVSALGEIPYLSASQIQPMHTFFKGARQHPGVAIANMAQQSMLTLITPQSLWDKVLQGQPQRQSEQAVMA